MNITELANDVILDIKTAYQDERIDTIAELNKLKEELVDDVAFSNTENEDSASSLYDIIMEIVDEEIQLFHEYLTELPLVSENNVDYEL